MLNPDEIEAATLALRALMTRGAISDKVILDRKDEVAKALHPLPPPWEWERMRMLVGLSASSMGVRTSYSYIRIRHWEKGGGTSHPDWWAGYAQALMRVVEEEIGEGQAERLIAIADQQVQSRSVQALIEQQRVTASALEVWLNQGISCSSGDLNALWDAIRGNIAVMRNLERKVRTRALKESASAAEEAGREREERNVTTGA